MPIGTIKWFNHEKGYGFIESQNTNGDVFLHHSALALGVQVEEGQTVSYDVAQGAKGLQAENVRLMIDGRP